MRVVFLGTPEIALPPLQALLDHSYEVEGVFTQPDRPSGRGQKLKSSPVKVFSEQKGIPVFQPEKIGSEENRGILESLRPDFLVAAAYGQILPAWVLETPRFAPLNIHFSLLPRYRGAAPSAHAILNGDSVTGVTIMIMGQQLDSGPVLMQREMEIPLTETTGGVETKLSEIGAILLIETMDKYLKDDIRPLPQDENQVSWAPRITKDDARIDWSRNALKIHNHIRAMNPWPGAFTQYRKGRLRIWTSMPVPGEIQSGGVPGTFIGRTENGLRVLCGEGSVLEVLELQKPSKKRVSGREFAIGGRLQPEDPLFSNSGNSIS